MRYVLCLLAALLSACPKPVCTTGAAKCAANVSWLCDSEGQWRKVMDCGTVEPKEKAWSCRCERRCRCAPGK